MGARPASLLFAAMSALALLAGCNEDNGSPLTQSAAQSSTFAKIDSTSPLLGSSRKNAGPGLGTCSQQYCASNDIAIALDGAAEITRPGWLALAVPTSSRIASVALYRNSVFVERDNAADFAFRIPYTRSAQATDTYEVRGYDAAGTLVGKARRAINVNIGRVLYVSGGGLDSNNGLSEASPKRTLAAVTNLTQPGDSVLVMNGTYSDSNPNANILTILRNGTSTAWIAYIAYPGHTPLLNARNWNAIGVQASYIIVDGMTLQGNLPEITLEYAQSEQNNLGNPITSGNGINISAPYNDKTAYVSHVVVRNCTVHDFPGGGIGSNQADYITITQNVVYRNGWYSPYGNSGISLYQLWNSDGNTGLKNVISRNISYQNQNLIPFFAAGKITDGNGIIVDDSRNEQNGSTAGEYPGRTLVENNVVYENGGRGVNIYNSDHVDVINNTAWHNALHPDIFGDLAIVEASDIRVINSIIVADPSDTTLRFSGASYVQLTNNLTFGPGIFGVGSAVGSIARGNLTADPLFLAAAARDFRLSLSSPAIDAGLATNAPLIDLFGQRRPRGANVDIGAFESY